MTGKHSSTTPPIILGTHDRLFVEGEEFVLLAQRPDAILLLAVEPPHFLLSLSDAAVRRDLEDGRIRIEYRDRGTLPDHR